MLGTRMLQATTANAGPGAGYRNMILADNPAGYWRLGERVNPYADEVAGNHGTAVGTVSAGTPLIADGGSARKFDGASAVSLGDIFDSVITDAQGKWTFEGWVKPTSLAALSVLFGKMADSSCTADERAFIIGVTSAGKLRTTVYGNTLGTSFQTSISSAAVFTAGAAAHVVVRFDVAAGLDSPAAVSMHVNNVALSVADGGGGGVPSTIADSPAPLAIGGAVHSSGSFCAYGFVGVIDEVVFYNRLLTTTEINAHYNAGINGTGP